MATTETAPSISVDSKAFSLAVTASKKVIDLKTTIPVLAGVQIKCDPHGIVITATDLEVTRQERIEYHDPDNSQSATWTAVVDVKTLLGAIPKTAGAMKKAPVITLRPDDRDGLGLAFEGFSGRLDTMPAEEYPVTWFEAAAELAKVGKGQPCEPAVFSGERFADLVGKILPSISSEESSFQLAAGLLEINGTATAVSTDGHRLTRLSADLKVSGGDMEFLAPRHFLACALGDHAFKVGKRFEQVGEYKSGPRKGQPKMKNTDRWSDVHVSATELHFVAESPRGVRYVSRIQEGNFPDYERVIRMKGGPAVTIESDAADIAGAVKAGAAATGDRARAVRLDVSGDYPVFSSANPTGATASSTLNGSTTLAGHEMGAGKMVHSELGLNPDYLTGFAKLWPKDERLTINLWDCNSQAQVVAESDPSLIHVIMPIAL